MEPLHLLQRRIIATNLVSILLLLFDILTALSLNARARSLKEADRYLGVELHLASIFSVYEMASGKPDNNTAPPYGEQMRQTCYPYVIFSKNETNGSYIASTTQDLSLSDTDTPRLQSLLQEIADKDVDTAQAKPPEEPEESEHLTHTFSSYYYAQGRQDGEHVFLVTSLNNLNTSLFLSTVELSGIFLLAGLLVSGFSSFLARMSFRPIEHVFSEQQRFAQDVLHELETPPTIILVNLSTLKSHPTATIRKEALWIQNTEAEAKHMQELTERLLLPAKVDAKNMPPRSEILSLSALAESMVLSFTTLAFERKLSLALDTSLALPVRGDAQILTQLLAVLPDSALEYAASGTKVTVCLCRQKKHTLLSTHNNGGLIPANALPRLSDRFFRVDKSCTRMTGDHGLGLSIAKIITNAHGGDIRADSTVKYGTVFAVTLPLSE